MIFLDERPHLLGRRRIGEKIKVLRGERGDRVKENPASKSRTKRLGVDPSSRRFILADDIEQVGGEENVVQREKELRIVEKITLGLTLARVFFG